MITLKHGNALDELRRLRSGSVDLLLTDPPYGNNGTYGRANVVIAGDADPLVGLTALAEGFRILSPNRASFFFLDMKHLPFVRLFVEQYTDFKIGDVLVWDKTRFGFGRAFRKQHELIIVLEKGKVAYRSRGFANVLSVTRVGRPKHPHEKPVALLERLLEHTTSPGDLVVDPFMGSGSTGVAASKLGRRFLGIELDHRHFEIARTRMTREQ